ncbi:hypothetical protein J5N97_026766 [Dioscorea zingiberensis]|uniref:DYW domain-containing protein n=1 Tax=Dioscorea zingiberensis TaxID=325984 RepID=A0A9D5H703_9LILI|nr:hypothetical protein J5N97_026766 [Dioscorea zingiberensis]
MSATLRHRRSHELESLLFSAISSAPSLFQLKQAHALLYPLGLHRSNYLASKLLRRLAELGSPSNTCVLAVFSQVPAPNSFLWTALIRASAALGPPCPHPLLLYSLMRRALPPPPPLSFTFSALLKSCSASRSIAMGSQLHAQTIFIGGFNEDLFVQNTLIDLYVQCGQLDLARKVFDEMLVRDAISWTSLIVAYTRNGDMGSAEELFGESPVKDMIAWTAMVTGYSQNGRPREALMVFDKMREAGVAIDEVSLVGAVSACAQLGAVKRAEGVRQIAELYGLGRNVVLGSAMVDMYAKCGLIDEARQVFNGMDDRNVYTYSTMITGLAAHGKASDAVDLFEEMVAEPHIAKIAGEKLFELEPDAIGNFVLLSNIFASAGMWNEVSNVRKLMRGRGLRKNPASSWMEARDGTVHEFFAGDGSHPMSREIKAALEELMDRLKSRGYVPMLSSIVYDVSESEKQRLLKGHCEKLALAFGLLTVDSGGIIRIVKNVRICEDCHLVMCLASSSENREIVVRDNMRFHHFKDGVCSCGGFW